MHLQRPEYQPTSYTKRHAPPPLPPRRRPSEFALLHAPRSARLEGISLALAGHIDRREVLAHLAILMPSERSGNCVPLCCLTAMLPQQHVAINQTTYLLIPTHIRSKASREDAKGDLPSRLQPHTPAAGGRRQSC
jgi:hypothetical protein